MRRSAGRRQGRRRLATLCTYRSAGQALAGDELHGDIRLLLANGPRSDANLDIPIQRVEETLEALLAEARQLARHQVGHVGRRNLEYSAARRWVQCLPLIMCRMPRASSTFASRSFAFGAPGPETRSRCSLQWRSPWLVVHAWSWPSLPSFSSVLGEVISLCGLEPREDAILVGLRCLDSRLWRLTITYPIRTIHTNSSTVSAALDGPNHPGRSASRDRGCALVVTLALHGGHARRGLFRPCRTDLRSDAPVWKYDARGRRNQDDFLILQ